MTDNYFTERHLRLPDGTFPHLGVSGGDVAPVVLLCGNPERVERIRELMDDPKEVGKKRGYAVYTGTYQGKAVSVAASGLGSPSLAIAVEELGVAGGRVFIRVGSCASCQSEVKVGDVIISTAGVRDEGTSHYVAPAIFPAVADFEVVAALSAAAEARGVAFHRGIVRSTDSFYDGERIREIIDKWGKRRVLAFEMESSALFTVATVLGYRSGSILVPGTNLTSGVATYQGEALDEYAQGMGSAINVSLDAAAMLS
ncbi:MAG: uridine phosphorylase [Chloroflexi bacterium]|nr:MAG: uridine phosphorylase [Chloroflexota bacterium]MBL1196450.1 uridine phosphorylase [Chloroflexota bacterium]NOH13745.1 nucleoside phosphorylase [Chloroflexota bacterium]